MPSIKPISELSPKLRPLLEILDPRDQDWPARTAEVNEALEHLVSEVVSEDASSEGTAKSAGKLLERTMAWADKHGPQVWTDFLSNRPL